MKFLCILGSFLKVQVQNGNTFGVAKISNIFWCMSDIPDTFPKVFVTMYITTCL